MTDYSTAYYPNPHADSPPNVTFEKVRDTIYDYRATRTLELFQATCAMQIAKVGKHRAAPLTPEQRQAILDEVQESLRVTLKDELTELINKL